MSDKPHISPTQVEMYSRCGEQYRRRYKEQHIIPPGISLVRGSAVHIGAELNYKQKVESHRDLPRKDIVDRSASAFDDKVRAEGILLNPDEESRGKKVVLAEGKDSTVRLAGLYSDKVAPQVQPKLVEATQTLSIPGTSHDLLCRLDVLDDQGVIRDTKTGMKTKPQSDWDASVQLTFYWAVALALKLNPTGIVIDQLIDTKEPKYVMSVTSRGDADVTALLNRVNAFVAGVRAGIFIPAPTGSWWCSPNWCGYWKTCSYINNERRGE